MQTYKYYRNGKLHRDDGPAVIKPDGTQEWYKEGKLHRDDGPAVIYTSNISNWNKDGKISKNKKLVDLPKDINEFKSGKLKCKL
jgi:hypothetical protein